MFCHVSPEQVFGVHDLSSVYHVPLLLKSQGVLEYLRKRLRLDEILIPNEMLDKGMLLGQRWKEMTTTYDEIFLIACTFNEHWTNRQERLFDSVTIALVGKYTDLKDSYMSVTKSLEHSAFRVHRKLIIHVR